MDSVDRKRLRELALAVQADQARVQASDAVTVWAEPNLVSQWFVATSPTRILELLDALDAAEQTAPDDALARQAISLYVDRLHDRQHMFPGIDQAAVMAESYPAIAAAIAIQAQERTP